MTEEPLIYTSKGNLPIKDLEYRHYWQDEQELAISLSFDKDNNLIPSVDKSGYLNFIEEYWLDDECVKRSVNVYQFKGLEMAGEQGNLNG